MFNVDETAFSLNFEPGTLNRRAPFDRYYSLQ
jgi:hypothetical protein